MNVVAALRGRAAFVAVATLAAVGWGVSAARSLPSGIYPDVDFPRIVVVARVGDLPPDVVQTEATRPLEEALATVPGLRRLRARTIRGATELSALFEAGTDMWRTLQLVETHIAEIRADLPPAADVHAERVTPTALPILTFNVAGGADGRARLEAATRILRPALTLVPGIGTVETNGGEVRELEVILRPEALAAAHLTPTDVADRLSAGARVAAVGRAASEHAILTVLAASEPTTPAALGALPVAAGPSGPLPLSALADVVEGAEDRTTSASGPSDDVVVVTVSRAPGASAPDVVAGAKATVARLLAEHALPAGLRVDTVYDQSVLIDDAVAGVRDAILVGIALSLLVLALFLRDARAGAAAAIAVPLTLVCTFGVMRLFGQTLNLMSLGGLAVAIGLVVDDAIVIVEAIVRRLEEGAGVADAAERGTQDLFAAVVGTTVTTVVVFAPLALISGVVGSFFGALAVTLCAAVTLSLVFSLTVVPLVAARLLRARRAAAAAPAAPAPAAAAAAAPAAPARAAAGLSAAYGRSVRRLIARPWLGVAIVLLLVAAGLLAARRVHTGFLPLMDEGAMVVDFFLPPGTSLDETDRVARRLDHVLETTPGVVTFTRRTGAEMGPAAATAQNTGDILVRLAPRAARASVYDIMEAVRARAEVEVPEARVELVQVLQDVLDDLSGNPRPIEVVLHGRDQRTLEGLAHAAAARLADLPDLEDFFDGVEGSVPVLRADVDATAAARLGVSPARVLDDLAVGLSGRVAAGVRSGDRTLGVRVRLPDAVRFDPEAIAKLPLAYGGAAVPLSALARLSRPVGPAVLLREALGQVVILTAAVSAGADLAATTAAVEARLRGLALPEGYGYDVGGLLDSARRTQAELGGVFALGVALILAVLLLQLRSLRLALIVLLGAPLALVGAVLTLLATGLPLDASSLMGCVLLSGLVVKNGILLLEHAQAHAAAAGSFAEAVVRAGERRLRPILMTTAATVAGLLPLAFGVGAGSELQRPLAVAVLGGLVLSTLVTLLVVPALACALMRGPRAAPTTANSVS